MALSVFPEMIANMLNGLLTDISEQGLRNVLLKRFMFMFRFGAGTVNSLEENKSIMP